MDRTVVWSLPGLEDLQAVAEYLDHDSPGYAASLLQRAIIAAENLAELPERGQVVPEFGDPTVREVLVYPYRLVYQIQPETMTILALVHGARRMNR